MSRRKAARANHASLESLEPRVLLSASLLISEFMASNTNGLKDKDGAYSDWIEVYNAGLTDENLGGRYLTDTDSNLTKWKFPDITLAAGQYLVVFASGKNLSVAGQELHTNFSLGASGEYLALVEPDGTTIDSQYAPTYGPQFPDVSYGLANLASGVNLALPTTPAYIHVPTSSADDATWMTEAFNHATWTPGKAAIGYDTDTQSAVGTQVLIETGAPALAFVPTADIGTTWHNLSYTTTGWTAGVTGVGYETSSGYGPLIGLNVQSGMYNKNQTCYIRINFNVNDPAAVTALKLQMEVDDGFVAWINGVQVVSSNAASPLLWNSGAPAGPSDPTGFTDFDISAFKSALVAGNNVLAIQGLNNGTTSSDFLILPRLEATVNTTLYQPLIQTDVQSSMKDQNGSVYERIPFTVTSPADIRTLALSMKYDDGFVAYINGVKVAESNDPASPAWNSVASAENADEDAITNQVFNISNYISLLHAGTNILAIQGLNLTASDTDFLLSPTLSATMAPTGGTVERYFQSPTPGAPNTVGTSDLGPIVTGVTHTPLVPLDAENIFVTAKISNSVNPVSSATLHYRVMYGTEVTVSMADDGAHGDGAAGDGVYGATIPASASTPGQMVRYYITALDNQAHTTRMPLYQNASVSEAYSCQQYYGTVVLDTNVHTNIPVLDYFFPTATASLADGSGAAGSVFYNGELYDNVWVRMRGSTINGGVSVGLARKVNFPVDHSFLYQADQKRVGSINVNLAGPQDTSYLRNEMSYWFYDQIGQPGPISYMMHTMQNGAYLGTRVFYEQPNEELLEREGLDPNGALYRASGSNLSGTGGFEKKTRTWDSSIADLSALVAGINPTNANRHTYVMDNIDLADSINYLVAGVIMQDTDSVQTNYYVYHDVDGTGEWRYLPYDRDLTWGDYVGAFANYTGSYAPTSMVNPMYTTSTYPNTSSRGYNRLSDAIKKDPVAQQMFFRRLRTVMDEMLKAPGTPYAQLPIEAELDYWVSQLSFENANGQLPQQTESDTFLGGVAEFKTYLANRRTYLYTATIPGVTIPAAQPASFTKQITITAMDSNPVSGNQNEEYIQLTNPNGYAVDISGWQLTSGVDYTFPNGTVIVAGGSLYVTADPKSFRARTTGPHGGQNLFVEGPFKGHLDNQGENVRLVAADNRVVDTKAVTADSVAINEIMTNSPSGDWIELYNPTNQVVNVGGWYLSDSSKALTKYRIPDGTTIAAGGYTTFTELAHFGVAFGMSKDGESIYLSNAAGVVVDSHDFGAADVDVTFGNVTTSDGQHVFTALQSPTLNAANSPAVVGPVVISEIMYNPLAGNDEFVELRNITSSPVKLYDVAAPTHTWTLSGGVTYTLPTGVEIPAQGYVVLSSADLTTTAAQTAFRTKYNIPATVPVLGPWNGSLNNAGDSVNINKPGSADPVTGDYAMVRVDRVDYMPNSPWPIAADGTGKSMERVLASAFGNDGANWASYRNGSPGYASLLPGDINLDGKVSFSDYLVLEQNFASSAVATWAKGDFNGDAKVSFADYLLLEQSFAKSVALPGTQSLMAEAPQSLQQDELLQVDVLAASAVLPQAIVGSAPAIVAAAPTVSPVQDDVDVLSLASAPAPVVADASGSLVQDPTLLQMTFQKPQPADRDTLNLLEVSF